jgi:hypothetical protein
MTSMAFPPITTQSQVGEDKGGGILKMGTENACLPQAGTDGLPYISSPAASYGPISYLTNLFK